MGLFFCCGFAIVATSTTQREIKMNKEENFKTAQAILESAVQFLAIKHNTTTSEIWAAVIQKHERVCYQLAEVMIWAIEEVQNNKAD